MASQKLGREIINTEMTRITLSTQVYCFRAEITPSGMPNRMPSSVE